MLIKRIFVIFYFFHVDLNWENAEFDRLIYCSSLRHFLLVATYAHSYTFERVTNGNNRSLLGLNGKAYFAHAVRTIPHTPAEL